jgi:hypothetical protein
MSRFQVRGGGVIFWVEDIDRAPWERHSQFYSTLAAAMVVRNWLHERELGYPTCAQFEDGANWPRMLKFSDEEGATWRTRTVRADAYDWTKGSAGGRD